VQEGLAANLFINRLDAWILREEWARANFESWARNLRLGWEWDENAFTTNMFGHPFHGAQYFNAGRANCLTYWESVPLAFLGSFVWEYFGETYRPSFNDFFMTSFGGIALGEMTHRVGASIRDNQATGAGRIGRELLALAVDPMGGLNRLFRGEWVKVGPNPAEHDPGAYVFRVNAGVRAAGLDSATVVDVSPTILLDMHWGDVFQRPFSEPFDVFRVRAQVSPGGGGLNLLRATGRLYQKPLPWIGGGRHRHELIMNQRYDYNNNPAYQFGQQSLELGIISRWQFPRGFGLRTLFAGDAAVLGAIDAPFAGVGERTYDFGPGVGVTVELVAERNGINYVTLYNRFEYLHTVSGASANHLVFFSGLEIAVPIAYGFGLGLYSSGDKRTSSYLDGSRLEQFFWEGRFLIGWTSARRGVPAAPR
jgi:hypothetical protein